MSDGALAATQYYHELLTSGRFDDTLARLQTGIAAGKLHICGSPASRVLRPFFVDEPVYAAAMATASEMAYALGRLRRPERRRPRRSSGAIQSGRRSHGGLTRACRHPGPARADAPQASRG